jgi:hypothetical protein
MFLKKLDPNECFRDPPGWQIAKNFKSAGHLVSKVCCLYTVFYSKVFIHEMYEKMIKLTDEDCSLNIFKHCKWKSLK